MLPNKFRQPREGWEDRQKTTICFTEVLIRFYQSLAVNEKQAYIKLLHKLFHKIVWVYTKAWGVKYNANPFWSPEAVAYYKNRRKHGGDSHARKGLVFEHVVPRKELVEQLLKFAKGKNVSRGKIEKLFQKRALSAVITKLQHKELPPHSTPTPWRRYKQGHVRIANHPGIPTRYRKSLRKLQLLA